MASIQPNTAAQIGQAATMKKYNDIPIDVLPDNSFARLYKPGTKTVETKKLDEGTREYDLSLQEDKRAKAIAESIAQAQLDETIRSNKADESYKWAALNKSSSPGTKAPTASEMLQGITRGAIDFAQRTMKVTPYNAESPYNAFLKTKELLNNQAAQMPVALTPQQYNEIMKSVAQSVGYDMPAETKDDEATKLRAALGL